MKDYIWQLADQHPQVAAVVVIVLVCIAALAVFFVIVAVIAQGVWDFFGFLKWTFWPRRKDEDDENWR